MKACAVFERAIETDASSYGSTFRILKNAVVQSVLFLSSTFVLVLTISSAVCYRTHEERSYGMERKMERRQALARQTHEATNHAENR